MTEDEALREFLLSHVRSPKNAQKIENPEAIGDCKNPLCGDHIIVRLKARDSIEAIELKASGCAISVASASLMSELVKGLSLDQAHSHLSLAQQTFKSSPDLPWPAELASLSPLKRIREIPMKIPCALIGWLALEHALRDLSQRSSVP
jgi:nitrogen fixation NifU-like protein